VFFAIFAHEVRQLRGCAGAATWSDFSLIREGDRLDQLPVRHFIGSTNRQGRQRPHWLERMVKGYAEDYVVHDNAPI
jgi:hypothetical protein